MTGQHWHNTFGLEHAIPFLSVFCSVAQRSDLDLEEPPSIISQSYRVGGMDSNLCLCGNKGAVEQITKVLAKELGPRAIRVNTVSPGPVDTELFRAGKTDEQIRQPAGLAALGRIGTPEDIADMVGLLVDSQAGRNFVTVSRSGRLSCLHIDENFLIFRLAMIKRFNNSEISLEVLVVGACRYRFVLASLGL